MNRDKEPLYRKVNTNALHSRHHSGGDARHDRNTKDGLKKTLKKDVKRGLDYTPLYRFLLSKVGEDWDKVHSEAISRLDKEAPIYRLVARNDTEKRDYVRCGENTMYSGLYIDNENKLRKVNPNFHNEHLYPTCKCCTHTFNGVTLSNKNPK